MAIAVFDKVYRIELPIPFPLQTTNVFLIDDPPRTLIDSGVKTESSLEALSRELETLGLNLQGIERILITHAHIDHYGMAKQLATMSGAKIYIHPIEYKRSRSFLHSIGLLKIILLKNGTPETVARETLQYVEGAERYGDPVEDALFLEDGDFVPFESLTLQAISCPGHSPGLLCYYWKDKKLLFAGDHLLKDITPNPVVYPPTEGPLFRYPSLKHYLKSLERIKKLELSLVLPGHREEIHEPKQRIDNTLKHHRDRMDQVFSLISKCERTPYEIAVELFPDISALQIFLAISETLGHLEILREKGAIRVLEKNGIHCYVLQD
jgi:glyoxylase-like metal-dependent hydrolase (beta-lactamase superfamily II)